MKHTPLNILSALLLLFSTLPLQAEETVSADTTAALARCFSETNFAGFLTETQKNTLPERQRTLYISPNVTTFARDAEYFLPYTKGYTALGFNLNPTLSYRHNRALTATIGVHLMAYAGDHTHIREILPIVRLEYSPAPWIRIVGGTLYGNLCHGLYEPMLGFDRYYKSNQENGMQAFAQTKHWQSELWCNWEDFIIPGSDFQEKFTFGWVNNFKITPFADTTTAFEIPLHLMMNHRGGQFDAVKDTCLETLANIATGLSFRCETARTRTKVEVPFFIFSNRSDEQHIHTKYQKGWGVYPQVSVQNNHPKHHWQANIGFWYGDKFISGRGSYLFQSRSYFDETFQTRYRKMATAKASYCLNHIFGFEFQAYYDVAEKSTDYAAGIYLLFDKNFKIHSWKKKQIE